MRSPSRQDDLTLPVSRFSRTIGWNVCGATFQLGPKSGMTGPWIANSSAIFCLSERLAYLPQIAPPPHPVAGNNRLIKSFQPPQLEFFGSTIRFRFLFGILITFESFMSSSLGMLAPLSLHQAAMTVDAVPYSFTHRRPNDQIVTPIALPVGSSAI